MEHASIETASPGVVMTTTNVQRMISEGIAAARESDRQNHTLGMSHEDSASISRRCTYKDFMICKPTTFRGVEGVTEMAHWFEQIETVFKRSSCPDDSKVTFATGALQGEALSWWNNTANTMGQDEAFKLSWNDLKTKMLKKYCPPNRDQEIGGRI